MPHVGSAGRLLEKRSWLEEHGVCNHHHTSGVMRVRPSAAQLHQVKTHKTHVDDISGDPSHRQSIPNPHAVPSNQQEIRGDGKDKRLQGDGDAAVRNPAKVASDPNSLTKPRIRMKAMRAPVMTWRSSTS